MTSFHLAGPFTYDAKKPEDIKFKPLRVPGDKYEVGATLSCVVI